MKPVNLLPRICAESSSRRRHVRAWTVVCGLAAIGVAAASVIVRLMPMRLELDRAALGKIDEEYTDLQRRTLTATKARDELLKRVSALRSIRRASTVPAQLYAVSASMPEGVKLTRLSIRRVEPVVAGEQATSKPTVQKPAAPKVAAVDVPQPSSISELAGYAVDHVALNATLRKLEETGRWAEVNLRRATSEKFGTGTAIAFQIECRGKKGAP